MKGVKDYIIDTFLFFRLLNPILSLKFLKRCVFGQKFDVVLPLFINFEICGVKMVTRIFEEFRYFATRENGAILGAFLRLCNDFALSTLPE